MLQAADRLFWAGVAMDVPACCSLAQKVDLYICLTGRGNEHLALVFAGCFFWKGETLLISRGYIEVIHQLEMFLASAATAHSLKRVLT